ncbi:hypothetical protein HME7025_00187 [Aquirufa nivalisilvae]|uniref:DUF2971 domain-containing protein n=1 Tax=Aquirufa nivalisilvae TaxID=2516557 RepID=A0A2S2DSQ2_9BACT|nr:DUF2971 domain-containing protein [Aquirufa nivalisilvae]AWL08070.1 hypothetical protein HME7025_00187 [Aquirufa nivalisilvae]
METPENYPEIVYKYRPWKGVGKKPLTHFELYLASPKDFNDPFDCRIPVNFLLLKEEGKNQYIDEYIKKHKNTFLRDGRNEIEIKKFLQTRLHNSNIENFHKEFEEKSFRMYDQRIGILSLSIDWNNILMWSHYAREHSGYCIGFYEEKLRNSGLFDNGGPVSYPSEEEYPIIHPLEDIKGEPETIFKNSHNKAKDWFYEKEYRLTKFFHKEIPTLNCRQIHINSDYIAEVIIGLRTPEAHKAKIIKICKKKGIKVFQVKQVEFKFLLDRDEI